MKRETRNKACTVLSLFTLLITTHTLHASTIVNSISVQSHSGGNTTKSGEVVKGTTKSSVDSVTSVNGKIVEETHQSINTSSIFIDHTVVTQDTETTITTSRSVPQQKEDVSTVTQAPQSSVPISISSREEELPPQPIINITEEPRGTSTTHTEPPSLPTRIVSMVSKTFAYVLSTIFSWH